MMYRSRKGNHPSSRRVHSPVTLSREQYYALPFVGSYIYRYDKIQDDLKRHRDYQRHTGREYAYPTSGFGAQAYSEAGQFATDIFRQVGQQYRRMV